MLGAGYIGAIALFPCQRSTFYISSPFIDAIIIPNLSLQPAVKMKLAVYSCSRHPPNPSLPFPPVVRSLLRPLIIMRHLQPRSLESTLHIEPLVCLGTVQDCLVTARILRHEVQRLNDAQSQLLALLVFCHGDVFDVTDQAEVVNAAVTC